MVIATNSRAGGTGSSHDPDDHQQGEKGSLGTMPPGLAMSAKSSGVISRSDERPKLTRHLPVPLSEPLEHAMICGPPLPSGTRLVDRGPRANHVVGSPWRELGRLPLPTLNSLEWGDCAVSRTSFSMFPRDFQLYRSPHTLPQFFWS